MTIGDNIKNIIVEHQEVIEKMLYECSETIDLISKEIISCYKSNGKLLIFGNGGSAADAQHFAAELVNRFKINRKPLPAIALTTDTSILTSIGNDFGFDHVFEKQIEAFAKKNDIIIAISTSGTSKNILLGLEKARELGLKTIAFGNQSGGKMGEYCNILLKIPSINTPRVQECHELAYHIICENVERVLFSE